MMPVAVMAIVIMCRRDVIGDAGDRRRTRCNRLLAQSRKRPMAAALALPVRHRSFIPPVTSRSVTTMVALGSGRGTDIGFEPRLVPKRASPMRRKTLRIAADCLNALRQS